MPISINFEPTFCNLFDTGSKPSRGRGLTAERRNEKAVHKFQTFLAGRRRCCHRGCARSCLLDMMPKVLQWRRDWHWVPQRAQNVAIIAYLADHSTGSPGGRSDPSRPAPLALPSQPLALMDIDQVRDEGQEALDVAAQTMDPDSLPAMDRLTRLHMKTSYHFLGRSMCRRSWLFLTGVSTSRLVRCRLQVGRGETDWNHRGYTRTPHQSTAMAAVLWTIIGNLQETMPLKDVRFDDIIMPFAERIQLFRMMQEWYEASHGDEKRILPKRPSLHLFYKVMSSPDHGLNRVKFHRVVEMGRCSLCCLLAHKCRTAESSTAREVWQRLACRHQWLQRAQKLTYATDRSKAASDYPRTCLYFAMDGSSGHDFVFPHMAATAQEGPSKAIKGCATNPLKVQNAVIHGDSRSHVILSPSAIVAGANHTCESIMIVLTRAFIEHADLPRHVYLQLDNAAPNHNILVMAFVALYVLEGVLDTFKLRFELPDHAHDIYDAYGAIHGRAIHKSTFFSWSEVVSIVIAAHQGLPGGSSRAAPSSLMGHDVLVSNLWQLRDIWEWLAPGYRTNRIDALSKGAFVAYDRLSSYHDFRIQADGEASVGLWAKQYMSDADEKFFYVGTLVNRDLFRAVVGDRLPILATESKSEQKTINEAESLKKLTALSKGQWKDQFSAERLADAIAVCRRDWKHFDGCPGSLPPNLCGQLLPAQLAAEMRKAGKRDPSDLRDLRKRNSPLPPAQPPIGGVRLVPLGKPPPAPRQFAHVMGDRLGVSRGDGVQLAARYGAVPKSKDEFQCRAVTLGCYVATRTFRSSPLARGSTKLTDAPFWVWRVIRVYQDGDDLDVPVGGHTSAPGTCYEAQLHWEGPYKRWLPCWNRMALGSLLRTEQEKTQRAMKRALRYPDPASKKRKREDKDDDPTTENKSTVKTPVWSLLRPGNLAGGGFQLTRSRRLPAYVRNYVPLLLSH